ncbi:extensin-like [Girardinichthys multiradiatus]|uniref:extensin-like n=1 Tax=Girardinichthys multiradiatus TaxID=208333 RepID=UPI001FAE1271|nr:extensin-like [Girardinichthys multiradiatus]
MLCRPTQPTTNRSPAPDPGPGPQKEAVERRPRRPQLPGTPPTPPPNPEAPHPTGHPHAPPGTTRPLIPRTPAPLPSPPPEVATDPQQKGPSHKRSPTPNKGADQPAQHNQNTPHKGGHMTSMSSHPRTHRTEPTERPAPEARHQTAATTRQAGQQNTSHSNTKAATKPHLTQNGRPTQMQAPGHDRYMHPSPIDRQTETTGPAGQLSRPHDAPPRPLPCPRERHRPSKPKGATERPQHTEQRGHTPIQRRRPTYIQVSQAKTIEPSQTADPPEPAPQQHHPSFCAFVGARRGPLTPSRPNPPGTIQQTSKPYPSMRRDARRKHRAQRRPP